MNFLSVLLQASEGAGSGWMTIAMMGAIIVVFYFFMIRPQQKKQKALQEARNSMSIGDKVVTAGGIHGKIKEIADNYFIIEIADNVKIKVDKPSVYSAEAPASAK